MGIPVFQRGERTDRPAKTFVNKNTAKLRIAQGTHEGKYTPWGKLAGIVALAAGQKSRRLPVPRREPPRTQIYIPDRLPPMDLPRLRFVEPQSDTWKLQHRSVTFSEAQV